MKWTPGSVSEDVEDRRGGGGGFRGGPVSIGVVLVLLVLSLLTAPDIFREGVARLLTTLNQG